MSAIIGELQVVFSEAIRKHAHEVVKDPDDWQQIQEIDQKADQALEECQKRFDREAENRIEIEYMRLAEEAGPSMEIKGPDGAPAGETIEQRAHRNVLNAHQGDLNAIETERTNALFTVLETARARSDPGLELVQGRAQDAFDQVSDRRKGPDRRGPTRTQ